jgi:biopolymer transport protein ExbD
VQQQEGSINMRPSEAFAKNKVKRRRNAFHLNIDLSALLAVMVALLFILIFGPGGGVVHHPRPVPADLPATRHATSQPGAQREDEMRVSVTKDGSIYFNGGRVLPEALPETIRDWVRGGAERRVYVAADARAKYGDVTRAVEAIRLAGIQDITFLTENRGPL